MNPLINCLIVEDEPLAQQLLQEHIQNVPFLHLLSVTSNIFDAQTICEQQHPDLVFLDVNLPMINGLDWLKSREDGPLNVILTTANQQYALEGFDLNVIDFLLKPITPERFLKAINRFRSRHLESRPTDSLIGEQDSTDAKAIYVRDGKEYIRLNLADILSIQSTDDYIQIKTTSQSIISTNRITEMAEKLPSPPFYRLSRSWIINEHYIDRITDRFDKRKVKLLDGQEIDITRAYEDTFNKLVATIRGK